MNSVFLQHMQRQADENIHARHDLAEDAAECGALFLDPRSAFAGQLFLDARARARLLEARRAAAEAAERRRP